MSILLLFLVSTLSFTTMFAPAQIHPSAPVPVATSGSLTIDSVANKTTVFSPQFVAVVHSTSPGKPFTLVVDGKTLCSSAGSTYNNLQKASLTTKGLPSGTHQITVKQGWRHSVSTSFTVQ